MIIRQLEEKDIEKVKAIHQKLGFDYTFPDLNEFFPIPAIVDSTDSPIMVVASLPTVELFFFGDLERKNTKAISVALKRQVRHRNRRPFTIL